MTQFRPMLAYNAIDTKISFPVLTSPKIDGIRCLITLAGAVTRTLKPIPNNFIRNVLRFAPIGLDGELTVGESFQETSSAVMSISGEPQFTFHVFDDFSRPFDCFTSRLYQAMVKANNSYIVGVKFLPHTEARNQEELDKLEEAAVALGFEGLMIRSPTGYYKHGRSTENERFLGKIKRFEDREGMVVGAEPLLQNLNPKETDNLGLTRRSSHAEGKVEMGTLGALIVQDEKFGEVFRIGTGFTAAQRKEMWETPPLGRVVKYKFLPHGTIDLPRHPTFLGFRDKEDM